MITALDTNILLDIFVPGSAHEADSSSRLDDAYAHGALIICEAAHAELAGAFQSENELDRFLADTGIRMVPSGSQCLWLAGQRWRQYATRRPREVICQRCGARGSARCERCGESIAVRQHVLADFLIGAHASSHADRLLTRDRGYYGTYFPELHLV